MHTKQRVRKDVNIQNTKICINFFFITDVSVYIEIELNWIFPYRTINMVVSYLDMQTAQQCS
jgi:hypothetical protein